ncbi:MAG: hypothetical protein HW416_1727, partial [Chloroflexi bacterium]|nr:hypothetical protein [Chloroflexota bacterium]
VHPILMTPFGPVRTPVVSPLGGAVGGPPLQDSIAITTTATGSRYQRPALFPVLAILLPRSRLYGTFNRFVAIASSG